MAGVGRSLSDPVGPRPVRVNNSSPWRAACNFDATWPGKISPRPVIRLHPSRQTNNSIHSNVPTDGHCAFIVFPYQIWRDTDSVLHGTPRLPRAAELSYLLVSATVFFCFFSIKLNLPRRGGNSIEISPAQPPAAQHFLSPIAATPSIHASATGAKQLSHTRWM